MSGTLLGRCVGLRRKKFCVKQKHENIIFFTLRQSGNLLGRCVGLLRKYVRENEEQKNKNKFTLRLLGNLLGRCVGLPHQYCLGILCRCSSWVANKYIITSNPFTIMCRFSDPFLNFFVHMPISANFTQIFEVGKSVAAAFWEKNRTSLSFIQIIIHLIVQ